ncbi:MAG: prolipoprotein diacylglyceryl transferase [Armatimonadetes bacterium]|nr:prolipoprotein diacylglyceryl transferase [Armatimonadota bacterium]
MYPIMFKIGNFPIYSYGVMLSLAAIVALYLIVRFSEAYGVKKEDSFDLTLLVIISGILGARLAWVLLNWNDYKGDLLQILYIRQGGLAWHGALIGGILAGVWFARVKKLKFWKLADLTAPAIILGQAIGRLGCFLNGCCYGKLTRSWLGVQMNILDARGFRHPTQVYELLLDLAAFFFLLWWRKGNRKEGDLFLLMLIIASFNRFLVEFWRESETIISVFSLAQLVSSAIILVSLAFLGRLQKGSPGVGSRAKG